MRDAILLSIDPLKNAEIATTRVLCYVPVAVKKKIQERRASDPRPSPPSESDYLIVMLRAGLEQFKEMPAVTTEHIFRIDFKNRSHFVPVGIRMPKTMHSELMAVSKQVPQYPIAGHEPVNYRFIDLVACLLNESVFGFRFRAKEI